MPWPYRMGPAMILAGLVLTLAPIPRRWIRPLGSGAIVAGVVLLAQAMTLAASTAVTARSHELPSLFAFLFAHGASLLGSDAGSDGSTLAVRGVGEVHRLGVTWDLVLDPATLCFFVGGLIVLALAVRSRVPAGQQWATWRGLLGRLALVLLVWLPVRAGLLVAVYLHRALRWDFDMPQHVMNCFFSPWLDLILLAVPVMLAGRFVRKADDDAVRRGASDPAETADRTAVEDAAPRSPVHRVVPLAAALVLLAAAILAAGIYWDPAGTRKSGRVMFVERHSTWSPTTRPLDTNWFGHDSNYNYAGLYRYLSQYYDMSQLLESDTIDDAKLAQCDVLIIKVPTARYAKEEVEAVVEFVRGGGGLLLIGDHTNYEKSSTTMNDVTRHFGFTYRHDLLFSNEESPYDEPYVPPRVAHPVVQHMPPMDFAVSCSIDPGWSWGRSVITGTRLWSLPSEYHTENYHPFPQNRPEMRYGAFVQLWSTTFGEGRVLAFTDSTIFSNFCAFQPGKAEFLRGMIEWLNHAPPVVDPRPWLLVLALLTLSAGLWVAWRRQGAWLVLVAAGTCGWVLGAEAVSASQRLSMPVPEALRPIPQVVIDRTTSDVLLSKGAYIQGEGEALGKGYGMLETWIPRLGYYTVRQSGQSAFAGDALVVICPSRPVSEDFREGLMRYVADGGRVLVVDSPENAASTANSLLWPFGLSVDHQQKRRGRLVLADPWPGIDVESACQVSGGTPLARFRDMPVAAEAAYGSQGGKVVAIGFGSVLNDAGMGYRWDVDPQPEVRTRFDVLFALVRHVVEDAQITVPPARPAEAEKPASSKADNADEKM